MTKRYLLLVVCALTSVVAWALPAFAEIAKGY